MPRCPNPRCQTDYPTGTMQCTNPRCQCLLPEAVVAGRYRIETLIGLGGMGAVYRVSDTFEVKQVALKILTITNSAIDMQTAVERFRREARYAHQLKHKNIVPVLNFGQDGSLLYLAMPLVTGGTLKSLLQSERPLPMLQAQRYVNDLAEAIDVIHQHPQQIVHRDIKPSNLLIHQDDGRLVLADFGIARAMQQEKPLTQRGWSLGTEHYIAPEQEQGQPEPASDIYAMGVVAYQMFTGLLPFQAIVRNKAAELPPPSKLNLTLPPPIDAVIARAMDIDPKKRFRSAGDFSAALNASLASEAETIAATLAPTLLVKSDANIIIRTIIPENPCGQCGRENRPTSRFCRYCGYSLENTSPLVSETYQVGYMSERGQQAQDNEDMVLIVQGLCSTLAPPPRPFGLFAVADGLRGPQDKAAGGHEASRLAVETITDVLIPQLIHPTRSQGQSVTPPHHLSGNQPSGSFKQIQHPNTVLNHWLRDAIRQANQVIYHCNADYETAMASTLAVAILYKHHLYVANVGDSRIYKYQRQKGLQQIFQPDTTGQGNGASSPTGSAYLGQKYQVGIELYSSEIEKGDLIVLCSDGLWKTLRDEQIENILSQGKDVEEIAQVLSGTAVSNGSDGNVSVVVGRVQ